MGIFMGRSVWSSDPSTAWLADLIKAAEVLGTSAEPCDPAMVRAFSHRLETPGEVRNRLPHQLHRSRVPGLTALMVLSDSHTG